MSEAITHYEGLVEFNKNSGLRIRDLIDSSVLDFYLNTQKIFKSYEKYKSFINQIATDLGLTVEEDKKIFRGPLDLSLNGKKVVYFSIDWHEDKIELESFGIDRYYEKAKEAADYLVELFSPPKT